MLSWVLRSVFGTKHDREVKRLWPSVRRINEFEQEYQKLTDEEAQRLTTAFRLRLLLGATADDLMLEAYAAVKNACRRLVGRELTVTGQTWVWDMVPFDVQLIGAIALHRRGIAEMATGEGKTLVAIMPLYLNGLVLNPEWVARAKWPWTDAAGTVTEVPVSEWASRGREQWGPEPRFWPPEALAKAVFAEVEGYYPARGAQLVTTTDYLARRDAQWVGSVLTWLGLTIGCIQRELHPYERRQQYGCDVCYGTAAEFGFDYLRDMGMAQSLDHMVQHDYYFVIVDEVDSILIDEARTPLIIAGPVPNASHQYDKLKPMVERVYRQQNELCSRLVDEARGVLEAPEPSKPEAVDEAYIKLVKVKLGLPTHKRYLRIVEDPNIRRAVEQKENDVHSDMNRGLLQALKDELYFAIDERNNDADLCAQGRSFLRPEDPEFFVLPDLPAHFAQIERDATLDAATKLKRKDEIQEAFEQRSEVLQNLSQLLKAYCLFEKDRDYIIQDNKIIIVDQNTGAAMPGRRYAEGLHQALEAKEDVKIEDETQTLATITIQNYFRMYQKLAGMTGTAETEANEFKTIYTLDVLIIPTNKPCVRSNLNDRVFKNRRQKYQRVVEEVKECHLTGQPVLVGTVSVEISELLSRMLRREHIPHTVLNAKFHQQEAEIVARAGQRGAVTVATNMAGRGTDIRLGEGVRELGGLHVIGSSRHDARRIDHQLRGRCARQGDPGSCRFYVSLEDELMRLFGGDRITKWMTRFGMEDEEELSHPWLNKTIQQAQKRVEQHHFGMRKRTLEYDDVLNKQRAIVYRTRREIITSPEPWELLFGHLYQAISNLVHKRELNLRESLVPIDAPLLLADLREIFPLVAFTEEEVQAPAVGYQADHVVNPLTRKVIETYQSRLKEAGDVERREWPRHVMLNTIDRLWQEHLYHMDNLRVGIGLRAQAQRDPLVEYKREAFEMFTEFANRIHHEVARGTFHVPEDLVPDAQELKEVHVSVGQFETAQDPATAAPGGAAGATVGDPGGEPSVTGDPAIVPAAPKQQPYRRHEAKVGLNDPCPCGSGKKYKKCCRLRQPPTPPQ